LCTKGLNGPLRVHKLTALATLQTIQSDAYTTHFHHLFFIANQRKKSYVLRLAGGVTAAPFSQD
jgi:hypothetical protein